ncbi:MAG: Gmad2 immunoglobulin-like domain-containing protein [Nitriliruptor sp.]|uniref:Gmad2 immunoglobulin-like domain-containing protein n=1 Tax=Nitriliruptor sp. TaxID=2448056 RepID=UPI0034A0110C
MSSTRHLTVRRGTALLAAATLVLAGCGGGDPTVVDTAAEPEPTPTEALAADPEDLEEPEGEVTEEPTPAPAEPTTGPSADDDELADPCAGHEDRDDEAFIEVVSPVSEQQASAGAVELVGCSNVYEANVQWSLYDGDGRELDTGFTTAECGSGCVGAFADSVPLDAAAGEPFAELHVYAEDAASGDRVHLTAIPLVLS